MQISAKETSLRARRRALLAGPAARERGIGKGGTGPHCCGAAAAGDGIGWDRDVGTPPAPRSGPSTCPHPRGLRTSPPSFFLPHSIRRRGCGEAGARRAGKRAALHLLCPTPPFSALPEQKAKAGLANGAGGGTRFAAAPGPLQCQHFWHASGMPFPTPCPENTARSEVPFTSH